MPGVRDVWTGRNCSTQRTKGHEREKRIADMGRVFNCVDEQQPAEKHKQRCELHESKYVITVTQAQSAWSGGWTSEPYNTTPVQGMPWTSPNR